MVNKPLDKSTLNQALSLLATRLEKESGQKVELIVCGGSALIAAELVSRTTNDVDILALRKDSLIDCEPLPEALVHAAEIVRLSLNLPEHWLNTGPAELFRMGLPEGFEDRLLSVEYGPMMTVHFAGRLDQIHFKLYAAADRGGYHVTDLLALKPTEEELLQAARWSRTHDTSGGYLLILKDMLVQLGYPDVAEKFRDQYLEQLLSMLWRSWNAIGAAGSGDSSDRPVDPEGLLLLTASAARYDARLFDEMLDWLETNGQFIHVQRLRNSIHKESFNSAQIIRAIAARMHRLDGGLKWKKLAGEPVSGTPPESLFFLPGGKPLPVTGESDNDFRRYGYLRNPVINRGHSRPFPAGSAAALHLQLRGLFGLSVRVESLLFLLTRGRSSVREIADFSGWSWRSVQEVLLEMSASGSIVTDGANRNRRYQLSPDQWTGLLLKEGEQIMPPVPIPVYRVLEIVLHCLHDDIFLQEEPAAQAAGLRVMTEREILHRLQRAGRADILSGFHPAAGEAYLAEWIAMVERVVGVFDLEPRIHTNPHE